MASLSRVSALTASASVIVAVAVDDGISQSDAAALSITRGITWCGRVQAMEAVTIVLLIQAMTISATRALLRRAERRAKATRIAEASFRGGGRDTARDGTGASSPQASSQRRDEASQTALRERDDREIATSMWRANWR